MGSNHVGGGATRSLDDIQLVTDAALARLETGDLLNELLDRVREVLDADTSAVLLLDPSGTRLVAVAARGLEEEVRQGVQIPVGEGFAGQIAAQAAPVILDEVNDQTVLNPILIQKGISTMLGVPLMVEGKTIGVLHVGSIDRRTFDASDANLLQKVADRIALAAHARQSEEYRSSARALQRSFVPTAPPVVPGLEIATRYATGEGDIGGDWYDVFVMPNGDVALVIGDVAGRGLDAAVVMARARSVLRAYSLISHDPGDVLTRMNRMFELFEPNELMTVFFGILNLSSGSLRYSSAGHLMPVLASPTGQTEALEGEADVPLGLAEPHERRNHTVQIPVGGTLYLFTDGLVERRGQDLNVGLSVVKQSAKAGDPERGCISILGATVGARMLDDDVALLGVQLVDPARH